MVTGKRELYFHRPIITETFHERADPILAFGYLRMYSNITSIQYYLIDV